MTSGDAVTIEAEITPDTGETADEVTPVLLSSIRSKCDALIENERVDKDVALGILKLFHEVETMMLELRHRKDEQLERMRHELDLSRMNHRNSEMLSSLSLDVVKLKEHRERDVGTVERVREALSAQQTALEQLQTQRKR